jgi:hypothetical protein
MKTGIPLMLSMVSLTQYNIATKEFERSGVKQVFRKCLTIVPQESNPLLLIYMG